MAMQISITDPKGQTTNYHRIQVYAPCYVPGQEGLAVNIASYSSNTYREIEKTQGQDMIITVSPAIIPLFADDIVSREKIYQYLSTTPPTETWKNPFYGAEAI